MFRAGALPAVSGLSQTMRHACCQHDSRITPAALVAQDALQRPLANEARLGWEKMALLQMMLAGELEPPACTCLRCVSHWDTYDPPGHYLCELLPMSFRTLLSLRRLARGAATSGRATPGGIRRRIAKAHIILKTAKRRLAKFREDRPRDLTMLTCVAVADSMQNALRSLFSTGGSPMV